MLLAHGGGGQLTEDLLREIVFPRLDNDLIRPHDDSAILPVPGGEVAFTTDSYVVQPLFFPGGDIGRLSVCGTVNDLAVCGAKPAWLSLALILEEGLPIETLERVLDSAAAAAKEAGVRVVTGDTKVVAHGQADGMYVSTAGVGVVAPGRRPATDRIRPCDAVLVSGTIADHGLAVMLRREGGSVIRSEFESDVAPLSGLIDALYESVPEVRFLRDPTRGGLAGVVADLARATGLRLTLDESAVPVRKETRYAAEMLGLDPLTVANEGKVVAVVPEADAERALEALRAHPLGRRAAVIGRFSEERDGIVELVTEVGGTRIVTKPYGEDLPRIC